MTERSEPAGRRPRRSVVQPWSVLWLTIVWVLLWRELSFANVLGGAILAVAVQLAFPLPPLRLEGRPNPLALAVLLGSFVGQMVVASVSVAAKVLSFGSVPRNAVIEVDLETESDFVLTVVALTVSLIPGSIVVEARRSTHSLFVHVLDARDSEGVTRERNRVLRTEQQIARAFGIRPGVVR